MDVTMTPPTEVTANNIKPAFSADTPIPDSVKGQVFTLEDGLIETKRDLTTIKIDGQEIKPVPTDDKKVDDKKVEDKVSEVKPKVEDKPKDTPKKDEPKTVAGLKPPVEDKVVKVDDKPATKVDDKKTITQISPVKPTDDTFDYSKYSPTEQTNLKNMSRQSREYVAKLIEDNKKLSGSKDGAFYQHEQAYTLSPEYRDLQKKQYLASVEGKIWEQALLNIKGGKKFKEITGFNEQGQPIMSAERDPSDADEIRIQNNVLACQQANGQFNGQMSSLVSQFQQRVQNDLAAIDNEQKNRFAWVQDPKLLDYSVDVEGVGERKVKDVLSDFRNLFPSYLSSTPGVQVAANLFVALQIQGAELRRLSATKTVDNIIKDEDKKVEPTSDKSGTVEQPKGKNNTPSVFSLDGMPTR